MMAVRLRAVVPGVLWLVSSCAGGNSMPGSDGGIDAPSADPAEEAGPDGSTAPPDGVPDTTDQPDPPCSAGAMRECYDGPAGTESRGDCHKGIQRCDEFGSWLACADQVLPSPESLGNGLDDDCNGRVDEVATSSQDPSIAIGGTAFWVAYVDVYTWTGDGIFDTAFSADVELVKVTRDGTRLIGPLPIEVGATTHEEAMASVPASDPAVVEVDGVVWIAWIDELRSLRLMNLAPGGRALAAPLHLAADMLSASDFIVGDDAVILPIVYRDGGGWISALAVIPRDDSEPRVVDVHGSPGWATTSIPEATWSGDGWTVAYSYYMPGDVNHHFEVAEVARDGTVVVGSIRTVSNTTRGHSLRAAEGADGEFTTANLNPDGTHRVLRLNASGAVVAEVTHPTAYWSLDTLFASGPGFHTVAAHAELTSLDLLSIDGTASTSTPIVDGQLVGTVDTVPVNDSFATVFSWDDDGDGRWEVFLTFVSNGREATAPVQASAE